MRVASPKFGWPQLPNDSNNKKKSKQRCGNTGEEEDGNYLRAACEVVEGRQTNGRG